MELLIVCDMYSRIQFLFPKKKQMKMANKLILSEKFVKILIVQFHKAFCQEIQRNANDIKEAHDEN